VISILHSNLKYKVERVSRGEVVANFKALGVTEDYYENHDQDSLFLD
jgi:hypothetical protein